MKACGYIFGDMSLLTQCPKIQKDNKKTNLKKRKWKKNKKEGVLYLANW